LSPAFTQIVALQLVLAAELIAAGRSDRSVADELNSLEPDAVPMSAMAVSRHRRAHVVAPAKALAEAAGKGRDVAEQRVQVMAAAEAGDPSAFIALTGIVADLRKVHERLERTAEAAERDNQRLAVSALSAQQLRAAEVRAKMGGVGGYAASKTQGSGEGTVFTVNFHFSGGRSEQIAIGVAGDQGHTLDAEAEQAEDGEVQSDPTAADLARLAHAFGARA
jgi:outer membrane receptor protein involved in Fe transport